MILEKSININGIKICYREHGDGFPLLLVHGMGSSLVFDKVIEPLSEFAKVIVIDLPGFGKSDKPELEYTIGYYVGILESFTKELNLKKFNIAGLSLGGWIVSEYVLKNPERVNKLVLISSAGLKPVSSYIRFPVINVIVKLILKYIVFTRKFFLEKFLKGSYFDPNLMTPEIYSRFKEFIDSPGAKESYLLALKNVFKIDPGFKNRLTEINVQTLIIWGKNDPTFPIIYAEEFNRLILNSRLELIGGCGHTVTLEKPREFCEILSGFIK
jgi:pimeloyl-ACP methyl ester carboxylesterase